MNSPKLKKNKKTNSQDHVTEFDSQGQLGGQLVEGKPWNSSRLAKITTYIAKKGNQNIFSLSNRSSNSKIDEKLEPQTYSFKGNEPKPKTAPHYKSGNPKENKICLSQQMTKLGPVVTQQVLDDNFEENLESINFYPQFRASLQQRKNLMYLKPYIKSNSRHRKQFNMSTFDGMEKLKTELYQGINSSQVAYTLSENQKMQSISSQKNKMNIKIPITNRSSIIEYMTEYVGEQKQFGQGNDKNLSTLQSKGNHKSKAEVKSKNTSLTILREKLKNRYKSSNYADKIIRVKMGEGVPITIIQ